MFRILSLGLVILTLLLSPTNADAKKYPRRGPSSASGTFATDAAPPADGEEEETYDPFADFSEFETNHDEEEDINFFKNGRMLTLGFQGGLLNYTGEMAQKFQSSFRYGMFISYFFDLHFAIQINWLNTDSPVSFRSTDTNLTGSSSVSSLGMGIKYFLNTKNVTKGLADLNPYFVIGMSSHTRGIRFSTISGSIKDSSTGFNGGMGIELPLLQKKLFWSGQLTYDLINFKDENIPFVYDGKDYGTSKGDMWSLLLALGLNF